jgi:hypothetical protein
VATSTLVLGLNLVFSSFLLNMILADGPRSGEHPSARQ